VNCMSYVSLINFVFLFLFRKGKSFVSITFNFQGDIFFSSQGDLHACLWLDRQSSTDGTDGKYELRFTT
jgi:hypothetical protein